MKKIILLLTLSLVTISCKGQLKKETKEKIRTYKIAFLTEQLNLTETEAEKFWPIYNKYDKKMMKLRKEERFNIRKKIKSTGGITNLSEKEAEEIIIKMKQISEERHLTKAKFYDKIKSVLSYKKILQLEISEHEFDRKLFRKFRHGKKRK